MDNQRETAAAFFVDFDNLYCGLLESVYGRVHKRALEESLNLLSTLRARQREQGTNMVLGRAYSAFDEYPGSEAAHSLSLMGYEPQYVVHAKGRSSADLQLSIDLLEVLLSRADIEKFVIIGGDWDFIPIARKVLEARRELLIVSLPESTSGDLIDRVGPERFLDATQLVTLPEEAQPDGGEAAEEPKVTVAVPRRRGARILGHTRLPETKWTPRSDEEALAPDRQRRCLRLLMDLAQHFAASTNGRREVWLSPFLKNEMAENFPDLTHPQRRRLVNLLKEQEKIAIEERQSQTGPHPYSVVVINEAHPEVVGLKP